MELAFVCGKDKPVDRCCHKEQCAMNGEAIAVGNVSCRQRGMGEIAVTTTPRSSPQLAMVSKCAGRTLISTRALDRSITWTSSQRAHLYMFCLLILGTTRSSGHDCARTSDDGWKGEKKSRQCDLPGLRVAGLIVAPSAPLGCVVYIRATSSELRRRKSKRAATRRARTQSM